MRLTVHCAEYVAWRHLSSLVDIETRLYDVKVGGGGREGERERVREMSVHALVVSRDKVQRIAKRVKRGVVLLAIRSGGEGVGK